MALKLGELVAILRTDNTQLRRGLAEGEAETRQSGERMGRSMTATALATARAWATSWAFASASSRSAHRQIARDIDDTKFKLRELSREYSRSHDQAILQQVRQTRAHLNALQTAARELGTGGFRTALNMANSFGAAVISVGTNVMNLVYILFILVAALAAVQAIGVLVGGVLGALPGLITGSIAAISTLIIGLWGLGDAFRETARGGGSMVDRARQVALAERSLANAQREATDAQEDLNRARATYAERMQDLARSIAGARLDEEAAVQAVADAERDLARARLSEDPATIARADLAHRQALHQLAEVQDRVEDLSAEQADATAKGVEGSDEVTAALERQRRAVDAVSDAEYELNRARTQRGGGGASQELTKIAASATAAVNAIKAIGPAWTELRLDVQERLFAGVDKEITSLWATWEPVLRLRLGSMATMFNGLFKEWAETSRKPEFVANIAAGWKSVEDMIDRVGRAVAGPGLEAFGKLSRAAAPMIDAIGESLARGLEIFGEWIDELEKSGELDQFFEDAGKFFYDTMAVGKDVLSILGSIVDIIWNSGKEEKQTAFDGFKDALHSIAVWLDDPANQEKVRGWIEKIMDFFFWIKDEAIPTVAGWINKLQEWADRISGWIDRARAFRDGVKGAIDSVTNAITGLPGRIASAAAGMWSPLWNGFKSVLNQIIGAWNRLEFTVGGGSILGMPVPAATFRTPDIPYLAQGGWIPPTPGGRLAVLAEAGKPEWALPDDKLQAALDQAVARGRAGSDGANQFGDDLVIENHIHIGDEVTRVVETRISEHDRKLRRNVDSGVGGRR